MTDGSSATHKTSHRAPRTWLPILFLLLGALAAGCGLLGQPEEAAGQGGPAAEIAAIVNTVADDSPADTSGAASAADSDRSTAIEPASETGEAAAAGADLGEGVAELQAALTEVYQQANPSVVYIIVSSAGVGSGFVYSQDGYIITNHHVASGGSDYEVVFANGERRPAELVGTDADSDLAVLRVDDLPDGVQPLPLADSDALQVGQLVVAIGNPFGEQGSMSMGIISGLGRSLTSQREAQAAGSSYSLPQVIQTDAPINPGNSGGPLLNLAGEVIGVNSAIASLTGANTGVGFSIPVNAVKRIAPELIRTGGYSYSYMGASFDAEVSLGELAAYGLEQTQGAYVVSVSQGGPADEAGLVAADPQSGRGGDLIVAIDGQAVADFAGLNAYLVFSSSPGQTVALTVLRDGAEITVPLTLGERP